MQLQPYRSWSSPLSVADVTAAAVRVADLRADGSRLWWTETRPTGVSSLVRWSDPGPPELVTPGTVDVRTRVHEYGGGAICPVGGSALYVNGADGLVYRDAADARQALTASERWPVRFADGDVVRARPEAGAGFGTDGGHGFGERLRHLPDTVWVRERDGTMGVDDEIVVVSEQGATAVVVSGRDFYGAPRCSPGGTWLAWLCWDHPDMPWDAAELWIAPFVHDGRSHVLRTPVRVAGGGGVSVVQPTWRSDEELWFATDASGWWNLARVAVPAAGGGDGGFQGAPTGAGEPWVDDVVVMAGEMAHPAWTLGQQTFAFLGDGTVACAWSADGRDHIGIVDETTRSVREIPTPWVAIDALAPCGPSIAVVATGADEATVVALVDPASSSTSRQRQRGAGAPGIRIIRKTDDGPVGDQARQGAAARLRRAGAVSEAEAITVETAAAGTVHAFVYPPCGSAAQATSSAPPLMLAAHGGPTTMRTGGFDPAVQLWTSRGWCYVDVNYPGSSGFGRAYREMLNGRWGEVDVAACVGVAEHLGAIGRVDGRRMVMRGSSAGGFTVLRALATSAVFAAGVSYYGVVDLASLAATTHKFEAHYLDRLVAPYPDQIERFRSLSLLGNAGEIRAPVIVFQGLDDPVVPPAQAESLVTALRATGVPHAYLSFPGEAHGFRRAETRRLCLEAELSFFEQVLGITAPDAPARVAIWRPAHAESGIGCHDCRSEGRESDL